jgi:uncharacterized protein YqgV (UPF0045/DUF77 family)
MPKLKELLLKHNIHPQTRPKLDARSKLLSEVNKMLNVVGRYKTAKELDGKTRRYWWSPKSVNGQRRISMRYDGRNVASTEQYVTNTLSDVKSALHDFRRRIEESDDATWEQEEKRRKKIITRRTIHMCEVLQTGPDYDDIVKLMQKYRRLAARSGSFKHSTEIRVDKRLDDIWEDMNLKINALTDAERSALTCWKTSTLRDAYEIDYDELMQKPYVSIRKVERVVEERFANHADTQAQEQAVQAAANASDGNAVRAFLNALRDD